MKKFAQKSATIILVITGLTIFAPVSFGETTPPQTNAPFKCEDLNNQNAAAGEKTSSNAMELNEKNESVTGSLYNKLTVITEEPLGAADNKNTFLCARQIVCSGKAVEEKTSTPTKSPSTGGATKPAEPPQSNTSATPPTSGGTTKLKRECKTTYSAMTACNGSSQQDINTQLSSGKVNATDQFTICEPVMVYVANAGNNLLYYYIGKVYRYAATLGGTLAVLIMIVAGVMYATAGDSDRTGKAKDIITKCLSGLALLFLSAIILYTINPNFFTIT